MKRKQSVVVIIIAIIVIVLLCLPWWMGYRAETVFKQGITAWNALKPGVQYPVRLVSYDRGWFHSTVTLRVTMPSEKLASLTKVVEHVQVTHGPIVVGGLHVWSLAGMHGVLNTSIPAVKLPYDVSVGYSGDVDMRAHVLPGHATIADNQVRWLIGDVRLHYYPRTSAWDAVFTEPSLSVNHQDMQWHVNEMVLQQQYALSSVPGLWVGKNVLQVATITLRTQHQPTVLIHQLTMTKDDQVVNNRYSGALSFTFNSGTVTGIAVGPLRLEFTVDQLNAMAVGELVQEARALSSSNDNIVGTAPLLLSRLPVLLTPQSALAIPNASVQLPQGWIHANARVTWPTLKTKPQTTAWRDAMVVDATVQVPVALVDQWVGKPAVPASDHFDILSPTTPYSAKSAIKEQPSYSSTLLANWLAKGYITQAEGNYVTHLQVSEGTARFNTHVVYAQQPLRK